jgi:hypothetical protein
MRAWHCELDTIEMLILTPKTFKAIVEGLSDAPFQVRASSVSILMQLIGGGQRLTEQLLSPPVIKALALLLEDETWRADTIAAIHLIFERSCLINCEDILREHLEVCGTFEAMSAVFEDIDATDQTKELVNRLLTRLGESAL